ncbi:hypothetical protein PIB30_055380 [Stylosanthes scabra]|uniref:Pentatricopeptide repeat-containing protein n=1 Tax=Stylosanthes scabra TaxID=79078 RepID=A0ABU6SK67_9FABA|nr:hypothetical protein [Stylosanthes scabra]
MNTRINLAKHIVKGFACMHDAPFDEGFISIKISRSFIENEIDVEETGNQSHSPSFFISLSPKMNRYPIVVSLVPQLECRGITPSVITLSILINCFCHLSLMDSAFSVLAKIIKLGHELNVITLTTLLKGFCINGMVGHTRAAMGLLQKLDREPVKLDAVMYSAVIDALCKGGLVTEAKNLFDKMIERGISPDVVSYTSLIHGFFCLSQLEDATRLLDEMVQKTLS